MQSASFWTVKYQTLYDGECWYRPNAGIKVYWQRERSRCNNWFEVKVFESYCQPSEKTNRLMGLIQTSNTFLDIVLFKYLLISLVRPHLEYCVTVWYPLLKKDEDLIENVRCRASKMLPRLSNLTYEEKLAKIEIPSMKYRWMSGDRIMVYKVLNEYDHCWNICLQLIIIL